jgi:hypothetical protein
MFHCFSYFYPVDAVLSAVVYRLSAGIKKARIFRDGPGFIANTTPPHAR